MPTPPARRTTTAAAVLAAAAPLAVATAPTASAEAVVVTDPAGDLEHVRRGSPGDIIKVRTTHGRHKLRVTVRHARDTGTTDVYLVWIDTDPTNPGPEYRGGAGAEVEEAGVVRVDGWARRDGTPVRCPGATVDFDFGDARGGYPVSLVFPRSCLGRPATVRVSVATEPDFPFKRIDWSPGRRRLGTTLRSGPVG